VDLNHRPRPYQGLSVVVQLLYIKHHEKYLLCRRRKNELTLDYTPGCNLNRGGQGNANWHRGEKDWAER